MSKLTFRKDVNGYISIICIVLLFLVFTSLSLALVLIAANSYKEIKKQTDTTFNTGALVSYIDNKIHNYDNGGIAVLKEDNIDILVFTEDNRLYKTFVYCYEGNVYEHLVSADTEFAKGEGFVMFEAEEFAVNIENDNLLRLNICVNEEDTVETFITVNAGFLQ